ncbi:hypothetical protein J1N35_040970 [Gossypium stocksii]|uniref:Reverse transcriptase n=1 Tax=Gossypium stocksii TaxID=47602 RepID=A0A9D3UEL5_9ROSI|nr:hypothetical protein J1N35_040970 [Gossypium stocksii]
MSFWVQIYDVPIGFFSKALAKQLGDFIGNSSTYFKRERKQPIVENQFAMDHDAEEGILRREERKKRQREETEVYFVSDDSNSLVIRDKRTVNNNLLLSTAVKRGWLCLAWRDDATIILQSFSKRHIDVVIQDIDEGNKWRFTRFYSSLYTQEKNETWDLLRNLSNTEELAWFVCGDFNEIMYGYEKKEGLPREESFRTVLANCHLLDVGYIGNWFTWERGNLEETNTQEWLNRGVTNED